MGMDAHLWFQPPKLMTGNSGGAWWPKAKKGRFQYQFGPFTSSFTCTCKFTKTCKTMLAHPHRLKIYRHEERENKFGGMNNFVCFVTFVYSSIWWLFQSKTIMKTVAIYIIRHMQLLYKSVSNSNCLLILSGLC